MGAAAEMQTPQGIWEQASADIVEINAAGRIVDYLDASITRHDSPEERVRQGYTRILVEEYRYPAEWIALECPISIGAEERFADVVVYDSPAARAARDQGRALLIVETKAPNKTSGQAQLKSYIFASSAGGGVWTNGSELAFFRRIEVPHSHLQEWTNIPRCSETWDTVGRYRKQDLRPPRSLKQVFRRCHNAIYRQGLDSEDIALDMVRIILAKYRDEQNESELCEFRCTPEEYATAEGRQAVGDRVRSLFAQVTADHPDVFSVDEQITIGDDGLTVVVNELQPFRFLADDETEEVYDVIGTAFEVYVASHLKGNRGQFFTNRLVVNMMVELLDPSERDVILDPAAGSGGFLIASLRHIRHKIAASGRTAIAKKREMRSVTDRLFGIDISPKLVRVAKTNMILNGDGHGGLVQGNSIRELSELPDGYRLRPGSGSQKPTLIMTNPPFGASHDLRVKEREILEAFKLGHVWTVGENGWMQQTTGVNDGEGVPPEILFLERCVETLAPGGKLAIVIARGVLDNRDALSARQYLLQRTCILGIINCHPNTFAPFNGTKASILIVEKKSSSGFLRDENYPVFMAISQRIGQDSQGREIYKQKPGGEWLITDGQRVLDHDMSEIIDAWHKFRSGRPISYDGAWTVPLSRIIASPDMRFSPVRYAPGAEQALAKVLELADSEEWQVERLGDIATIFNGPRFKRPFAIEGVTAGDNIVRMYTPKALFEERGESAKYLDLTSITPAQRKAVEVLTLHRDWIMIVDSGTAGKLLGKVGLTTAVHEGAVGNNNMIRVVIEDPVRRSYVYQFLRSDLGQILLLRNVYGTNQDHIEPDDVKNIPVPFPRDLTKLNAITEQVQEVVSLRERAAALDAAAKSELDNIVALAFTKSNMEAPQMIIAEASDEE